MNKRLAALLIFFPIIHSALGESWKLVWSDEFNYQGLPDTNKWGYEEGFIRNQESQYYTRARLKNARVENGCLVIECCKEDYAPTDHKVANYTSASLTTQNKAAWQYGRIEVRAKLPQNKGVWPAIWMLGTNKTTKSWPSCGEIDIMEYVGWDTNKIHGNIHYAADGKHQDDGGVLQTNRPFDEFHVYAIEWNSTRIDFYFDDIKYHTVNLDKASDNKGYNPFHEPSYLILNFALGGSWGGSIEDSALPQKFLIDYVRVYQKNNSPIEARLNSEPSVFTYNEKIVLLDNETETSLNIFKRFFSEGQVLKIAVPIP